MRALLLLLFACGPAATKPGGPSGPTPTCVRQAENALRFDCAVRLPEADALEILLLDGGEVAARFHSPPSDLHTPTLWGLSPQTAYTARFVPASRPAEAWEEPLSTGALPSALQLETVQTGTPTVEHLLFPFQCERPGHLVLLRISDGTVVWYQRVGADLPIGHLVKVDGFELDAPSRSIDVLVAHSVVRRFAWTGEILMETGLYFDTLPRPTHHDLHRQGPWTVALNAADHEGPEGSYVVDGVYVLDEAGGVVQEWDLIDHLVLEGGRPGGYWSIEFPGSIDYTHANNIFVTDDGDWLLSFRAFHSMLRVAGPESPDFGEIRWALSTLPDPLLGSDFQVVSTHGATARTRITNPHHATFDELGRMLLFDNGHGQGGQTSRVLALVVDEDAGVADIVEAWDLPLHCPVQGSVYPLPSGNLLATCPTHQTVYELAPDEPEPVWSLKASCTALNTRPLMVRAQPVDLEAQRGPEP